MSFLSQGSTQKTKPKPWSGVAPHLKSGYAGLAEQFGEGTPPTSPYTQQGYLAQAQRAQAGSPYQQQIRNLVGGTLQGNYLSPESNPYLTGAINAAVRPVREQFTNTVIPGIDSRFSAAGRYGSGAHAAQTGQATQGFLNQVGDIGSNMAYQNYGTERAIQNAILGQAPGLAASEYADPAQLAAAGSAMESYQDRFLPRYGQYLGMLNQTPWGQSQTTQQNPMNTAMQAGLLGASIYTGIPPTKLGA